MVSLALEELNDFLKFNIELIIMELNKLNRGLLVNRLNSSCGDGYNSTL